MELKILDNKLLHLLHQAHILVGNTLEENKACSIHERLRIRLDNFESFICESSTNELDLAEIATDKQPETRTEISFLDEDYVREQFVEKCLETLELLQYTLTNINDLKGVRDLRLIHTMLEIVITWGVYPCLLSGVGVPLSRRTRSGYIQNELLQDLSTEEKIIKNKKTSPFSLYSQLYNLMKSLTNIMFTEHLTDVYAALLQLAYGPLSKRKLIATPPQNNDEKLVSSITSEVTRDLDEGEIERMHKESIEMFRKVFESADSFQSLEALTMLLSSSTLHLSPKWFKSVCGRFLSQILLRPNGIRDVIDFMIGGEGEVNLTTLETISKLILSVPNQVKSIEVIQSISNSSGNSPSAIPPISNVSSFTIVRMANKYPALTKKFVITKIFGPLWKWWGITSEEHSKIVQNNFTTSSELDPLMMNEQTLRSIITVIHRILVGSEPVPDLIHMFLEDSVAPLYHLYAFTSTETLKEIVFRKNRKWRAPELGEVCEVYFAPGSSGDAVMRLRLNAQSLSDTKTSIDVEIFINFLKVIANKDLSGDFFMYLLTEYTYSLAQYKGNSRRILTLINLVLAMIDCLGSSILQKPEQMVAFVNNVLEGYHRKDANQEERKESILDELSNIVKDEDSNDEASTEVNDDEELLYLALTLLSSLLEEHKNLSIQDSVFDNLELLQNHSSPSIQSLTRNIRLTILARNASKASSFKYDLEESMRRQESLKKYQEAMDALQDEILPIKARGILMLKEMILEKDPLMDNDVNLNGVLDIFIQMVQVEESFIYLNAVKGLSTLTDVHGEKIMRKLMVIYSNDKQSIDNRLRIGEAILQTIRRCGEALGKYIATIFPPLLNVLNKDQNVDLRVSALSIIGFSCETSPLALTTWFRDVVDWTLNILDIQKEVEVRRASHSQNISLIPSDLLQRTYHTLQYIEEIDKDELTRYHARVGITFLDYQ
ncbi:13312_t:CDS:10 [Funneliformis geosporum]|uniref:6425_t:CDS:1 n=1 Tax=Funneliformis geosporum TaxID=1117311 RepID=A0A9W4WRV3_9GLOM|nr:13312_t:CDS:10 [Funneliformis geosporum]CAI2181673.1 6425_t:CDS:10 [Funneliformis geosporum]